MKKCDVFKTLEEVKNNIETYYNFTKEYYNFVIDEDERKELKKIEDNVNSILNVKRKLTTDELDTIYSYAKKVNKIVLAKIKAFKENHLDDCIEKILGKGKFCKKDIVKNIIKQVNDLELTIAAIFLNEDKLSEKEIKVYTTLIDEIIDIKKNEDKLENEELSILMPMVIDIDDANIKAKNKLNKLNNTLEKDAKKEIASETKKENVIPNDNDQTQKYEIVKVEKPTEEEKKKINTKKIFIGAAATLLLIAGLSKCSSNIEKSDKNEKEENIPASDTEVIDDVQVVTLTNINDEENLYNYASYLKSLYVNDLEVEDIVKAIKLANFSNLENKNVFESREDVYNTISIMGNIYANLGSDKLIFNDYQETNIDSTYLELMINNVNANTSLDAFENAKEENGYNIYKVIDILVKNIDSNENVEGFSKLYNEIMVNTVEGFKICVNSNIEFYYTILGVYNQTLMGTTEKYATIYGDGEKMDGYYGYICDEMLQKYTKIGNPDNIFYTDKLDEFILQGNTRKR